MPRPEMSTVDLSRPNFALPMVGDPEMDDRKNDTGASNQATIPAVGVSSRFRLPPRYQGVQDDDRNDAHATKVMYQTVVYPGPKPYLPTYDPSQRTGRPPFHVQYHPTNHPPATQRAGTSAGAPNWSSWTSAAPVGTSELTAWRQPFEMRRTNMGDPLHNGMPALLVRQEATTESRLKHSNVATRSPQMNAPIMDMSHHPSTRQSDPSASANGLRHPTEYNQMGAAIRPRVSYTTYVGPVTQNSTSTSIRPPAPSTMDIGWHHRIGNEYKYRTLDPRAHPKPFASPSTEESKLPPDYREYNTMSGTTEHKLPPDYRKYKTMPGTSEHAIHGNSATFQTEKRVLSPPREQHTKAPPQFKRAKGFDKLDLLCTATLEIGELHDNPTGCSCPKSKCVALYCDCFKAGRRCHPDRCSCLDCKNTIAESGVDGARTKAIRSILARNPRAFTTAGMGNPLHKLPPGEIACNCVHSRCLKLYCSCFHNGKVCNPSICTCVRCGNTTEASGDRLAAIQQAKEKRADAFVIKPKVIGQGCACKNNRCLRKYCECFRTELQCTAKCRCRDCENRGAAGPTGHTNSNEIVHLATTISSNSSEE